MWWQALLVAQLALLVGCAPNMAPVYTPGEHRQPVADHYVVQKGDTLYSISWRHGLDYRTVARWNRIDPPYTIHPGQRLRLTAAATSSARASSRPPSRPAASSRPQSPPKPAPVAARSGPVTSPIAWRWPADGRLARQFATDAQGKQGIELQGSFGQPITAAAAGQVVYAGSGLRGYGNLVIIKHNGRYLTAYGYNREILVREGDSVQAGQQIATMGVGPGREAALHFELRRDGKPVDPIPYLPIK
jgi:lipoprotein NlpD